MGKPAQGDEMRTSKCVCTRDNQGACSRKARLPLGGRPDPGRDASARGEPKDTTAQAVRVHVCPSGTPVRPDARLPTRAQDTARGHTVVGN